MEQTEKIDMEEARRQLCDCFAAISDAGDIEKLLSDLCTYTEIEQLSQRLVCAKLLLKGCTYNEIIEVTDVSSATLSRVSRCIRHGCGGYNGVLAKLCEDGEREGQ
ncbi:MAG: YerC/YecD family TrpR-related protein [Clostridia bacterium]|nr:YerC/YecD family TrpR-related protein [Clostridia bacterium]